MINLEAFSDAVLDFQVIAQERAVDQFQEAALGSLQKVIPFDSAWWGIMSPKGESFDLHASVPYALPDTWVPMWEALKREDAVAQAVRQQPRTTAYFDASRLASVPGLHTLTSEHGIGQALCTSIYLPSDRAFVFLSLYRSFRSQAFAPDERELNQYLMPHLCSSWTTNRLFQMECIKASVAQKHVALALVDRHGHILNAEPQFQAFMQIEWPSEQCQGLPTPMVEWFRSGDEGTRLSRIVARRYVLGDLRLIAVRELTSVDMLSTRETQIARAFSQGVSYKEIARNMDIAPATVRHHLRAIYTKLEVGDKAEMASLLHESDFFLENDDLLRRYRSMQRKAA
ncbi:MAG: helix-turn-helix transcriptional regulator [Burkholderiales bacterium]|nr:helix-turn-helix transcriptional regulator [Burkholderiales bacterium]